MLKRLLVIFVSIWCVSGVLAQPADSGKGKQKNQGSSSTGLKGPCSSNSPKQRFYVDFGGSVSDTGRVYEGPLCVEVFFNPIQSYVGLQSTTSLVAGPDVGKGLGIPSSGGALEGPGPVTKPTNLPAAVQQLYDSAKTLTTNLNAVQAAYAASSLNEDQAISDISLLRKTTQFQSGSEAVKGVKDGYSALEDHLRSALTVAFVPTDQANTTREILLSTAQGLEDQLGRLPLDYPNGAETNFSCLPPPAPAGQVSWGAWFTKCKDDVYTPLKTILDANLQLAKSFTGESDNATALKKKLGTVQYWNALFSTLGLNTTLLKSQIEQLDISPGFFAHREFRCGVLFNQTANTAVNIVAADLGPTLAGNDPTIKAQGAFGTVSCGTPFTVSAGIGFNTIEQKQFAIIKSSDGKGGTMNIFGTTSDSKISPVVLALGHVRLAESNNHKFAFYGSLGVGGSLQNLTNASPVTFLPGVSVSFWRTMFVTVGPSIGNQTSLAGGFKEGDTVPSTITAIDGQTKTSHTVGFGVAISFTKP